ncbi:hypothetical protein MUK42_18856 [Musa troglodytarum]|uniref:Uncharacterized protein n=1 Tax=Musa troglodytarum TaxID=320322 RepID=A0A9E7IFZ5_9LILI|nr:hypothetical protein MUK42_18856 [Musa troglodytarum]
MTRKVELFGHSSRVLYLAGSPLGGVVASTVEDEALRLWNVFETPKPTKPELPFADLIVAQRSLVELKWQHIFMEVWLQAPKVTTFAIRGYGGCEGSGPITSISWSPDSSFFAFGNSVLALVDPATGQDVNVTEDDENLTPVLSFAWRKRMTRPSVSIMGIGVEFAVLNGLTTGGIWRAEGMTN